MNIKDQYTFYENNNVYVVINGKEYKYRSSYSSSGDLGWAEDFHINKVYDITNKKDQEEYYWYLKSDKLIDAVLPKSVGELIDVKEMSLQDYNSLIEHILKKKV